MTMTYEYYPNQTLMLVYNVISENILKYYQYYLKAFIIFDNIIATQIVIVICKYKHPVAYI